MDNKNKGITRRTVLKGMAGSVATAAVAGAAAFPKPAIAQNKPVVYTLSWLPTGQYAYVTLAKQIFWKKRGLNVEVKRGFGSLPTIQAIATKKFDLGGTATSTNLLSILKGVDIQLVSTQAYDSTMGIIVPADGPIKKPKDLADKKFGAVPNSGEMPFLPTYLELSGVDPKSIETVVLDQQLLEQALLQKQVDCLVSFGMTSMPNFLMQNFPVKLLPYSSVGLNFYWVSTVTRSDFLKDNKSLMQDIAQGLHEAQRHALLNPDEAMERHLKEHPEIAMSDTGKAFTEIGVGMINANLTNEVTQKHSLGYADLKSVAEQAKLVKKFVAEASDKTPPPVESYCTNEFIGKVTLSPEEWQGVKTRSKKYADMLGLSI